MLLNSCCKCADSAPKTNKKERKKGGKKERKEFYIPVLLLKIRENFVGSL